MLYLGTRSGIYRVTDGGGELTATLVLEPGTHVMCVAVGTTPGSCYAGLYRGGLLRSRDDGASWTRIGEQLPHQDIRALAVHPSQDGVIYAGTEPAALYRSEDGGDTWRELVGVRTHPSASDWAFPIRPKLGHVRTIVCHPRDPATLVVGIEVGSLLKSTDGGETWQELNGCGHDIHRALVLDDADATLLVTTGLDTNAYARTGFKGLFRSTDAGASFAESNRGLERYQYCEDAICADPSEPRRLWMATANGIPPHWASMTRMVGGALFGSFAYFVTPSRLRRRSGAEVMLFASEDAGASWQPTGDGLPTPMFDMVWGMDVTREPDPVLCLGTTGGDLYVSRDRGAHWSLGLTRLSAITHVVAAPG